MTSYLFFCIDTDKEGNDCVLIFSYINITNGDPKFSVKVLIITKLNHYFIWKSPLFLLNLEIYN